MSFRAWDWKFFLTISVAIAGVALPIIWQSDFSSKALELRLTSLSSLEPASKIRNLEMFLDGNKLEAPYASTIELVNSGSKPIMSKDFDTPVEIYLNEGARFAGAQISATSPSGLPIQLNVTDQSIVIAKHLSNPGDSMTLSVVTSGKRPDFGIKARIAGVSQIPLIDLTLPKSKLTQHTLDLIALICGATLFAVSSVFFAILMGRPALRVPSRVSATVAASTYFGSVLITGRVFSRNDISWGFSIAGGVCVGILGWMMCRHFLRVWEKNIRLRVQR